jgi:hypothetical protein
VGKKNGAIKANSLTSALGCDIFRVEGKAKSIKFAKYFWRPIDLQFHWLGTVPSKGTLRY